MKKIVLLCSVFLFIGCEQKEFEEKVDVNPHLVSKQMASIVSDKFMGKIGRNSRGNVAEIENTFVIGREDMPVMHVVNYDGGGFVLVSGDKRLNPILAYSENNTFDCDEKKFPDGLKIWINEISETIEYIRENDLAQLEEMDKHWNDFISSQTSSRALTPNDDICANLDQFRRETGPLLVTTWHQEYPFNMGMPMIENEEGEMMFAYVGCVPIAIAQIMKYHTHPTSYEWHLMPNSTATAQTLGLFDEIHEYFGNEIDIESDGTGVDPDYPVDELLMDFDFQSAIQTTFDKDVVENELLSYGRPVIIRARDSVSGKGHAWVCDGARTWYECIESEDGNMAAKYLYFHMNWGWNTAINNYNGWYGHGNFNVGNSNYNQNKRMVYQIIP